MADKFQEYIKIIDDELNKFPAVVELEKKAQVPKAYVALGVAGCIFTLVFFNIWGELIANFVGFLYPAYCSFKAVETEDTSDDTRWLVYWTVYGFTNVLEFFSDTLLYWIPFYYLFKVVLVLYLYLPQTNGAEVVYHKVIRPYLLRHEDNIDERFQNVKSKAAASLKTDEPKQD